MKYPKEKNKRNLSGYEKFKYIEGERIEEKVARLFEENQPINDGAPLIYTERKDGVLPAYDIRTDRFAIAQEAMEKNMNAVSAKRKMEYDIMVNGDEKNAKSGNDDINQDTSKAGATQASA
jgi:hypothetical protein